MLMSPHRRERHSHTSAAEQYCTWTKQAMKHLGDYPLDRGILLAGCGRTTVLYEVVNHFTSSSIASNSPNSYSAQPCGREEITSFLSL